MMSDSNNIKVVHQLNKPKLVVLQDKTILIDRTKCLIISGGVFMMFAFTFLGILLINRKIDGEEENTIFPYTNIESLEIPEFMSLHKIIDRQEWGGRPVPADSKPLRHPTGLVIIAHTVTRFCSTFADCWKIVAAIENYHLSIQLSDISYNFLIGGDGNIYVGRGWDVTNALRNESIAISFIGNYLFNQLNEEMIEAAQFLLSQGIELGKLSETYKIVGHNQTRATLSPGANVYKVIKNWKHFSPEIFKRN